MKKLLFTTLVIGLAACNDNNDSSTVVTDTPANSDSACFWQGPYVKEKPETNKAYPDTGAAYWSSQYTLPAGATLKLIGQYPYARYMSYNTYRADASPADALSDDSIVPNAGSVNPFVNGNDRVNSQRDYQVTLAAGARPSNAPSNTLYDKALGKQTTLVYRVYVPNKGKNLQGGVPLPKIELTLKDGRKLAGKAACDTLKVTSEIIKTPFIPAQTYAFARQKNPAKTPPLWRAAYNPTYTIQCGFLGRCEPNPKRQVAWFANLDNQYIASYVDRSIKPIVVIRGKLPKTPKTLNGDAVFSTKDAQLRYWSICQNEFYSQKVESCLYDEQIKTDANGNYTIVTGLVSDKPSNATKDCGANFLPWSASGDGFSIIKGMKDNKNDGLLIIRNMKPLNGFTKTVQNTKKPGDEAAVLGEYMPKSTYYTKAEFEALGCGK